MEEQVLYYDTDSIVWIEKEGFPKLNPGIGVIGLETGKMKCQKAAKSQDISVRGQSVGP